MLFLAIMALSIILVYFVGLRQKDKKTYLAVFYISYLFIFSVMCTNFLLMKFTDGQQLVFPDENLYVYDITSTLLFAYYVQFIDGILGLDVVRAINIIIFSISLSMLSSEIVSRVTGYYKPILIGYALLGSLVGSYWAFFILKEAFSVAALSMLILAHIKNSKTYFLLAGLLLAFARVELLALYFAVSLIFILKRKVKPFYYLSFLLAIVFFVTFMNSDKSYSLKLFTLSRRFGEDDFKFDDIAVSMSHLKLIPFILSEPFRQAVFTNLNSTFNPFIELNPFVFIQRLYNSMAFLVFALCMRRFLLKDRLYTLTFIIILGVLCTHSVYRYLNTILIPLTLYFVYLLSLTKQRV